MSERTDAAIREIVEIIAVAVDDCAMSPNTYDRLVEVFTEFAEAVKQGAIEP